MFRFSKSGIDAIRRLVSSGAEDFARVRDKIDRLSGGGQAYVDNSPDAIVVHVPTQRAPTIPRATQAKANSVTVKITGNASGGGKYNGRSCSGSSTAVASGNLSMPEGMTVASSDDCLILNYAENGLSTHVLTTNSFHEGFEIDTTSGGLKIIAIDNDSLGAGTSQYQVLQMTTATVRGWDWVRAH